jgi:hypothetical protein
MNKILLALVALSFLVAPAIADNIPVTAEVQPFVSAIFSYNTVNFGKVLPVGLVPAPGQELGIYNVTLTTNVYVNVTVYRDVWHPLEGEDVLALVFGDNTSLNNLAPKVSIPPIMMAPPQVVSTLPPGYYTDYHGYWLAFPPPERVPPGTYSTTVTITYQPA